MKTLLALAGLSAAPFGAIAMAASLAVVDSVAQLRGGNFTDAPYIQLASFYAGSLQGGSLVMLDKADRKTADNGCTVFVDSAGNRFKRPIPMEGLPLSYCGGVADFRAGDTDNAPAINRAKAVIEASGKTMSILLAAGAYRVATPLILDAAKVGLAGPEGGIAHLNFYGLQPSATPITFSSSNPEPAQTLRAILRNLTVTGPAQTGSGDCIHLAGSGTGVVADVSLENVGAYNCGHGIHLGASTYLVRMSHVNFTFNGINVYIPHDGDNSGENISIDGGSVLANATTYAVQISNPNASLKISQTSIDYNYNAKTGVPCQVDIVDAHVSISLSHIEAQGQSVDCINSRASTPALDLTDNTYVRATPSTTPLITAGSGAFVSIKGGSILSAGSPPPTIVAGFASNLSLEGTRVGAARFVHEGSTVFRYCPTGVSCVAN